MMRIIETLTKENIDKRRIALILKNIVGLSSKLVSKMESNWVIFSIKDVLYYHTKKYEAQNILIGYMYPQWVKKL